MLPKSKLDYKENSVEQVIGIRTSIPFAIFKLSISLLSPIYSPSNLSFLSCTVLSGPLQISVPSPELSLEQVVALEDNRWLPI